MVTIIKYEIFGCEEIIEKLLATTDKYMKWYHNGGWSNKDKAWLKIIISKLVESHPSKYRVFCNIDYKQPKIK